MTMVYDVVRSRDEDFVPLRLIERNTAFSSRYAMTIIVRPTSQRSSCRMNRGVMCNWMVSTGVVAAMMSTSVSGKVIGMWMPILVFFYMGFEHSIVNMFLFPAGLMLGGHFTFVDYLLWNEIPTVIGNLVGGLTFVGATLYSTHYKTAPKRRIADAAPARGVVKTMPKGMTA